MADDFLGGIIAAIIGFFFGNKINRMAEKRNRKIRAAENFREVIEGDLNRAIYHYEPLDKIYGSAAGRHEEIKEQFICYLGWWEKIWFKRAWEKYYGSPEYGSISLKQYMDGGSPKKRKKIEKLLKNRVKKLMKYAIIH